MDKKKILIVDDMERNIKMLALLCQHLGHETISARNGVEAVAAALREQPDAILMDIMMPEMNGFEATEKLKGDPLTQHIPVIMVTALDSRADMLTGIAKGANDFLSKPVDTEELTLRLNNNLRNKEFHDFLKHYNQILEEEVADRTLELRQGYIETIHRLTLAAEFKDEDTGLHINRISHYTKALATELGMDSEFTEAIFYASPMHDIGKVAIPDAILLKNGPLDKEEWAIMKTHPSVGARILEGSRSPYLVMATEIALGHHERWDGHGYPNGLRGDRIPLAARIMNIADQYDALRSRRPYKPPFDHAKTLAIITEGDGRTLPEHFDPEVLAAFRKCADIFNAIFENHQDEAPHPEAVAP